MFLCPRGLSKTNFNTVGGSPTASHFFLLRQRKSNQKEGDPSAPPLQGSLGISQASGAAQLALAGYTKRTPPRSSNSARLNLRLFAKYRGGAQGKEKRKFKTAGWALRAHPLSNKIFSGFNSVENSLSSTSAITGTLITKCMIIWQKAAHSKGRKSFKH